MYYKDTMSILNYYKNGIDYEIVDYYKGLDKK